MPFRDIGQECPSYTLRACVIAARYSIGENAEELDVRSRNFWSKAAGSVGRVRNFVAEDKSMIANVASVGGWAA